MVSSEGAGTGTPIDDDALRGLGLDGPPQSVLIVMLSAIGDAVHVLPVANSLRRAWPDTRISWIVQPVPARIADDHPAVDELIPFHRTRGLRAWRGFSDLRRRLAGRRFDLLIGLQVYFKAGLITSLAPADVKLGFDRARARDANWLFTNRRIPTRGQRHVQDQYLEFVEALGVDPDPVEWGIRFNDLERQAQSSFFQNMDRPLCAVVVGTSKEEKNWSPEGYASVLNSLEEHHGFGTALVGGPSAVERRIADRIMQETRARPLDTLGDDVRRLMWILDGSALVISPDTGPLHIARALDVPVVGLYGYTNPRRTGPYGKYMDLVVDGYARYPGEDYPVSMEYRNGMRRITPEAVLAKVARAVDRYGVGDSGANDDPPPGDPASPGTTPIL